MSEYVEQVDEQDRVIDVVERDEAVRKWLMHRIAVVVCRDGAGRVLVHRRGDRMSRYPGHYDTVIGGGVDVGESYEQAAAREFEEEMGVRLSAPPRMVFKRIYQEEQGPYWMAVHDVRLGAADIASIAPNPREVAWWGWTTEEEIRVAQDRLPFIGGGENALWTFLRHADATDPGATTPTATAIADE
ncbi:NUDIX domain-containing protein [Streptomyces sp. NPDC048650]|uniref:NUDIX domain-containing protein n=1 Tax=unclassified Streptomyces TaxID=2593676 RepID=UPI00371BA82E